MAAIFSNWRLFSYQILDTSHFPATRLFKEKEVFYLYLSPEIVTDVKLSSLKSSQNYQNFNIDYKTA